MKNDYDYVIIGAGSSGCVLANKLSADSANSVLLVESGPPDTSWLLRMPRGFGKLLGKQDEPHSWHYEASRGGNRENEAWQKGRTLGGSSSINGMVYVRGHPKDYDRWAEAGCIGWDWATMRGVFEKIETLHPEGEEQIGSGPLHITIARHGNVFTEGVIEAAEDNGIVRVPNNNEAPDGGIGYQPATIWRGRRQSAAKAFLDPVRNRSNLDIVTDTTVLKIVFEDRRATAALLRSKEGDKRVSARREIIIAAGAIESPKLLQLSGVGPAKLLANLGISVVYDSPDVGRNLREHLLLRSVCTVREGSLNAEFRGLRLMRNMLQYSLFSSGAMTTAVAALTGFVKSHPDLDRPDIQLGVALQSFSVSPEGVSISRVPGISFASYFMHPQSRGTTAIRSADPAVPPAIDANYLADPADRQAALATLRLHRKLIGHPAVARYIIDETRPGRDVTSDDDMLEYAATAGSTGYHVSCTCRMGTDPDAVVDSRLRVRGVKGLRVVDTSIMPEMPSGNTNGPAMAIGWRGAEMIAEDALGI